MVAAFSAGMTKAHEPDIPVTTDYQRARRVLLVDDDPSLQAHIVYLISKAGHYVNVARDKAEALQQIEMHEAEGDRFDLLIIDIDMAGGAGLVLLGQIRALKESIPVLVLTNFFDSVRFNAMQRMACPDIVLKSRIDNELLRHIMSIPDTPVFGQKEGDDEQGDRAGR